MHRPVLLLLMLCAILLGYTGQSFADTASDEASVRAVVMRQAETWNRHDAKAYADLFATNADSVNVLGWRWKGREEINRKLTAAHQHMFKDSTLTITDVQIRFLTPEVAGTPAGHPDLGSAKTRRAVAHRGFPEHERNTGSRVPGDSLYRKASERLSNRVYSGRFILRRNAL
jgi:uncharacterized protein (TIGR02246 family)